MSRPPPFTPAQRLKVFETYGAIVLCQEAECGKPIYIKGCDIDHWLAVIDGGTHQINNWRPLCEPCHAKKSAHEHKENCRAKRRKDNHLGLNQPSLHKIASRPFPKQSRPMQSRPFAKRDKPNDQGSGESQNEGGSEKGGGIANRHRL